MKRSPLKRKTSLRPNSYAVAVARIRKSWNRKAAGGRSAAPLRRTPLKKVSRSQKTRLAKYYPIAAEYLSAHPACGICLARGFGARPATEVHHMRGRLGLLLFDTRFFCPSCRECRLWPHDNKEEARKLGVLAERNEWEVIPKVSMLKEG